MNLVYKNETTLFAVSAVLAALCWLLLVVGTAGTALLYLLFFFIFYLFAQSAFISYIKGTAVEITPQQFPDLHDRIQQCCDKLDIAQPPRAYLLSADGILNALATKFLRKTYIVLFSDIVDALEKHPDGINFYIGHELGHLKRKHLNWGPFLAPALILPLLGAAYSRAREYTCDLHGLACCNDKKDAAYGLAVLAAGSERWQQVNIPRYLQQVKETNGFWMSFHELTGDYPWLCKRMLHLSTQGNEPAVKAPVRNPLAFLFALFVPRTGMGGGAPILIIIVIIGILAAVALPMYQNYTQSAQAMGGLQQLMQQQAGDGGSYEQNYPDYRYDEEYEGYSE